MRRPAYLLPVMSLALCAAGCTERAGEEAARDAALIAQDPVIARALHDPLLTDPDLSSRNEANAAIGFVDSGALPVLGASPGEVRAAREAMRLALLEGGAIPDLPLPRSGESAGGEQLGPMSGPGALLAAVGAPAACTAVLAEDFRFAASLPPPAAIPPRAMVVQAGGADAPGCALRIVRYVTPAPAEDVLQFHYASASRAGLPAMRLAAPGERILAGGPEPEAGAGRLAVHLREAANGLTGVTLVYRAP